MNNQILSNDLVFVTFFNSRYDYDYNQPSYLKPLLIFYVYDPPRNYHKEACLINTNKYKKLQNQTDFYVSRYVKFFPALLLENKKNRFVYFDYRIKLMKKFIAYCHENKSIFSLKHREGGNLNDEINRNISRNRIKQTQLSFYFKEFTPPLNKQISENGVFLSNYKSAKKYLAMEKYFNRIERDQLLTPIFIDEFKFIKFTLKYNRFFIVRPKKLNTLLRFKMFLIENLPFYIWYR